MCAGRGVYGDLVECVGVWEGVWGKGEGACVSVVRGEGRERRYGGSRDVYVWVHVCVVGGRGGNGDLGMSMCVCVCVFGGRERR